MFRTVNLKVNAAHPEMPLEYSSVYSGSAASFTIIDVPRSIGRRTVENVILCVTNVDEVTQAFNAVRVGSAWAVTVPASAIGESGRVENGIVIYAVGKDENGVAVPRWIIGVGELEVMEIDGTVQPGVVKTHVVWFDSVPAEPKKGYMAEIEGAIKIYNGTQWKPLVGTGYIRHADFSGIDPETVSIFEIAQILKGE